MSSAGLHNVRSWHSVCLPLPHLCGTAYPAALRYDPTGCAGLRPVKVLRGVVSRWVWCHARAVLRLGMVLRHRGELGQGGRATGRPESLRWYDKPQY
eukprot:1265640-Rhodomonas_salina.1